MRSVGDVSAARARIDSLRSGNLAVLLEQRYSWMNAYITERVNTKRGRSCNESLPSPLLAAPG